MLMLMKRNLKNKREFIKVSYRTMYTTRNVANKAVNMNLIRQSGHQAGVNGLRTETALNPSTLQNKQSNNMATLVAYKVKGNAAKDLANDGTGKHAHVCKDTCVQPDCESKNCNSLCDVFKETTSLGHNTHKPPVGRFARFVAGYDANGVWISQYFVRSNFPRTADASKVTQYNVKDLKNDPKQTQYVNSTPEIQEKYDE